MSNDPFANPFSLSNNDRRQLNSFFDDDDDGGGGYAQVNGHDHDDNDDVDVEHAGNGNTHYQHNGSTYHEEEEDDDEDKQQRRRRNRRGGRQGDEGQTLGNLMPNMFSTNHSSSVNTVWLSVLVCLVFVSVAYYGLSKKANDERLRGGGVDPLLGSPLNGGNDNGVDGGGGSAVGAIGGGSFAGGDASSSGGSVDALFADAGQGEDGDDGEDDVGEALVYEQAQKPKFPTGLPNKIYDPFQLIQHKPIAIKDANDWAGAPFVVSPPKLPTFVNQVDAGDSGEDDDADAVSTHSRLGYFQYPTIINGTLVFSTEGDLYLTHLDTTTTAAKSDNNKHTIPSTMPAMKLTTTVGNAIHPKLNPKYPYLLAYSATYSGVREVYLMDLRSHATKGGGAPGTPGGPALRLTYTPGGIYSVVGWDKEGRSILYSAMSRDMKSLPDVRLFRLKLFWGGDGVGTDVVASVDKSGSGSESSSSNDKVTEENNVTPKTKKKIGASKKQTGAAEVKDATVLEDDDDDDDDDYTIADAQEYVDQLTAPIDNKPPTAKGTAVQEGPKGSSSPAKTAKKQTNNHKGGDNDDDKEGRRQRMLEKQRHRLAELRAAQTSTRPSRRLSKQQQEHFSIHDSIIEPVPLAQATEGVYYTDNNLGDSSSSPKECIYFTRFKQSSSTKRYVGGTAESLWGYCPNDDRFGDVAFPLTGDYNGTSKSPSVYYGKKDAKEEEGGLGIDVLFFMSDRAHAHASNSDDGEIVSNGNEWVASSMDLWAAPLPLTSSTEPIKPVRVTSVACQHNGVDLSEYAIDMETGGIILRIGADLHYMPMESVFAKLKSSASLIGGRNMGESKTKGVNNEKPSFFPRRLPIAVYSDFSNMQERLLPLQIHHFTNIDAYATSYGTVSMLLTARGQTFVAPVLEDTSNMPKSSYGGGGRNMPARRYKVAPGTGGGGLVRILSAKHIPQPSVTSAPIDSGERLALVLATDPLSPTGEHAFYLIRSDAMASPAFGFAALYEYDNLVADTGMPAPFLGGHLESGGSTRDGGLGSVYADSIRISPCGRRFAFTDTDGRIVVVTMPTLPINAGNSEATSLEMDVDVLVLPSQNELGQPLVGRSETRLAWSPGGRYLAIEHKARNQFKVISIADIGPTENGIKLGRIVQATPDRFNSFSPVWGKTSKDFVVDLYNSVLNPTKESTSSSNGATALIYLSDRDVKLKGATSPWGSRAPNPSFEGYSCVHVLPLQSTEDALSQSSVNQYIKAPYGGGGAAEVAMEGIQELTFLMEAMQKQALAQATATDADAQKANATEAQANDNNTTTTSAEGAGGVMDQSSIIDTSISFGKERDESFSFARASYHVDHIPAGQYAEIVCQLEDDPSLLLLTELPGDKGYSLNLVAIADWPSDSTDEVPSPAELVLQDVEMSSDGKYLLTIQSNKLKATPRKVKDAVAFFADSEQEKNVADVGGLHLSVWPHLEFQQMYADAWRMLRDYFYDPDMHSVDWDVIFERYLSLVERCSKREELDDVLEQMIGELSALHSFVYGGEYPLPHHGDSALESINEVATLGATLERSAENGGYMVVDIPQNDPDFHMIDGEPMYSPLSNQVLKLSGQAGMLPGDIIVAVNGENVMDVPDIHMLLRNTVGESVRLDVLRTKSSSKFRELQKMKRRLLQNDHAIEEHEGIIPEPLIVVPMSSTESRQLSYASWEWRTREKARTLAEMSGFSCGYIHVQSMSGASAMDSFVRGFYPDYDKEALIIDVRNNRGGNIDSWLLDVLQKRAWMYWESRSSNITTGGLGWDMQYAFRGHLVVLINEHTSSDGEGFARGVSELGLGKLIGTRTWGGGIWLSSDNKLVDGGIASAPEVGTYNDKHGWGLGIEQMGVRPDIEIDNNPKSTYDGEDAQLDHAVNVLKEWLEEEPVVLPKQPGPHRDMSQKESGCSVE